MGGRSCSIIYHHSATRFGPSPRGSTGAVPRWAPLAAHQGMECSLSLAQVKGQPGQEQDGLVPPPGPHLTTLEPPCPRQSPVAAGVHFGPSLAHSTTAHTSIIQATKGCCGSDFPGDFMFLSLTFLPQQNRGITTGWEGASLISHPSPAHPGSCGHLTGSQPCQRLLPAPSCSWGLSCSP